MFSHLGESAILRLDGEDSDKGYIDVDAQNGTIVYITIYSEFDGMEDYRRKGFGRKLVELAEEYLQEKGFTTVRLQAVREARAFWEKLGYTSATHDENYSKEL